VFGPILEDFSDGSEPYDLTGSATLFDEYTEDVLNEQQRSTLARLVAAFDT